MAVSRRTFVGGIAAALGYVGVAPDTDLFAQEPGRPAAPGVVLGPPASVRIRGGAGASPPELLGIFERAFSSGRGIAFQYVDRVGAATHRTIEPHGLLVQLPVWYILSRDVDTRQPRTFRMDRISRPRIVQAVTFQSDADVVRAQIPRGKEWRPLLGFP
jgi:predicted DNA-binding transcriptional regulator YafY